MSNMPAVDIAVEVSRMIHTECAHYVPHDIGLKVMGLLSLARLSQENERMRAALLYWRNECSGREPSLSVFERMVDRALSGEPSSEQHGDEHGKK
jgi:hypothetical protein